MKSLSVIFSLFPIEASKVLVLFAEYEAKKKDKTQKISKTHKTAERLSFSISVRPTNRNRLLHNGTQIKDKFITLWQTLTS